MNNPKLMGFVLLAENVAKSREFYENLLGQSVELDINGINVAFNGGLTLWQKEYAHNLMFSKVFESPSDKRDLEIYFEITEVEECFAKLEAAGVKFMHPIVTAPWQQRGFRAYDPDGFIVEISESMPDVIIRLHKSGMQQQEIVEKTMMPQEVVSAIIAQIS